MAPSHVAEYVEAFAGRHDRLHQRIYIGVHAQSKARAHLSSLDSNVYCDLGRVAFTDIELDQEVSQLQTTKTGKPAKPTLKKLKTQINAYLRTLSQPQEARSEERGEEQQEHGATGTQGTEVRVEQGKSRKVDGEQQILNEASPSEGAARHAREARFEEAATEEQQQHGEGSSAAKGEDESADSEPAGPLIDTSPPSQKPRRFGSIDFNFTGRAAIREIAAVLKSPTTLRASAAALRMGAEFAKAYSKGDIHAMSRVGAEIVAFISPEHEWLKDVYITGSLLSFFQDSRDSEEKRALSDAVSECDGKVFVPPLNPASTRASEQFEMAAQTAKKRRRSHS